MRRLTAAIVEKISQWGSPEKTRKTPMNERYPKCAMSNMDPPKPEIISDGFVDLKLGKRAPNPTDKPVKATHTKNPRLVVKRTLGRGISRNHPDRKTSGTVRRTEIKVPRKNFSSNGDESRIGATPMIHALEPSRENMG